MVEIAFKIFCGSKVNAVRLLSEFIFAKCNEISFPDGFRIISDKTELQRKLLWGYYSNLDRRTENCESGLRVIFENDMPKVHGTTTSNRGSNRRIANRS